MPNVPKSEPVIIVETPKTITKCYQTIKLDDISHWQGWKLERMFRQHVHELVTVTEPFLIEGHAGTPQNQYGNGGNPPMSGFIQQHTYQKLVAVMREFALLSRDLAIVTHEQELKNMYYHASLLLEEKDQTIAAGNKQLDENTKTIAEIKLAITSLEATNRDFDRNYNNACSDRKEAIGKLDKLKLAIGELRFNEIIGVLNAVEGEHPITARVRNLDTNT